MGGNSPGYILEQKKKVGERISLFRQKNLMYVAIYGNCENCKVGHLHHR